MCPLQQTDSSFEEIMEVKRLNRERLMQAIEEASPEERAAATERLREAMRKPEGEQRRQRLGSPAFCMFGK
ncbi:hypothetical protein [Pseudomonas fluorescens]|uniref:Uncharacterized protein n=1 Tax=Pseudomonas fluorescens TaxID=294 RepID=A0A0D0P9Y1_PSEFL|nr:hypothetical protein [Pseudomonas fluorescens]KIQ57487.1 hypothetical protein RL74_20615 [Pseudomonas fluorescens]